MSSVKSQTLVSRVHQHLLSKLASQELSKGAHLNATNLAEELGASRTTVRKAIDHLIADRWVEIDQNRHPVVVDAPELEAIPSADTFEYENQTERTYHAIQEKVLRGEYEPGATVRAPDLAAEFKVSLITVRQALDWLCKDGMFLRIPRKGWQVVSLSADELADLYHCRLLLEPVALKEAMKFITSETLDQLEAECDEIIEKQGNITRFERLENDMRFHRTLVESAGSHTLSEVIAPLIRKRFAFKGKFTPQHQPHTYAIEHKAILQAIRAGDLTLATRRLTDHISRALNTHLKLYQTER